MKRICRASLAHLARDSGFPSIRHRVMSKIHSLAVTFRVSFKKRIIIEVHSRDAARPIAVSAPWYHQRTAHHDAAAHLGCSGKWYSAHDTSLPQRRSWADTRCRCAHSFFSIVYLLSKFVWLCSQTPGLLDAPGGSSINELKWAEALY